MSGNLGEETSCDVFVTDHCTATEGIKNSSFSCLENAVTEMIHREALNETLNQSSN